MERKSRTGARARFSMREQGRTDGKALSNLKMSPKSQQSQLQNSRLPPMGAGGSEMASHQRGRMLAMEGDKKQGCAHHMYQMEVLYRVRYS